MPTDALAASKVRLVDHVHSYCNSNIDKSDFSLHREHFNAVKSFPNNNTIVISKPYKYAEVVIFNKYNYVNKMTEILNDTWNLQF